MKNKITAVIFAVIILAAVLLCSCGNTRGGSVVGVWKCELYSSEQIIEFTSDGRFIDYISSSENRYRTDGSDIIIYVENEPDSEVSMKYKVKGATLVLGQTEYIKVETENVRKDKQ